MKSTKKPRPRGFAAMPREDVMRICTMGGNAVVAKKGSKHMARIGAIGGRK